MVDLSRFGTKHECFACGAKFYDLNKPKPVCPKCGETQTARKKKAAVKAKLEAVDDIDDLDTENDDVEAMDDDAFEGLDTSSDGVDDDDDADQEHVA